MPKRSGKPNSDPNVSAFRAVARLTGSDAEPATPKPAKKNPHAVALGRKGGKIGGAARARNLTPKQLAEIGRKGAAARWKKKPGK
jgi:general stress protein YciG